MKTVTSYQDPSATGAFDVREPESVAHSAGEPVSVDEVFSALQDPSASAPIPDSHETHASEPDADAGRKVLSLSAQDPALILADTAEDAPR